MVLSGDHPLVSRELIAGMIETHEREDAAATVLTTTSIDPRGYGRVVRAADGSIVRIVETKHEKDVAPEELGIREINVGAYVFAVPDLLDALDEVAEVRGERYLTEVVPILIGKGRKVVPHPTADASGAHGVNTRVDLMEVEALARRVLLRGHALAGVTFVAPDTVTIDAEVEIGEDTVVGPGVSSMARPGSAAAARSAPHDRH